MSRTTLPSVAHKAVQKPAKKPASAVVKSKPKTLSQAQADFTAEGSPPPGLVGGGISPPSLMFNIYGLGWSSLTGGVAEGVSLH